MDQKVQLINPLNLGELYAAQQNLKNVCIGQKPDPDLFEKSDHATDTDMANKSF
jgi:hypothetical protein